MSKTTFIYALYCPIESQVKYIGKSNDPKSRFRKHKQMADNNHLKNDWIRKLLDCGLSPILEILEEVLIKNWKEKEKLYISQNRSHLLNICGGANGLTFGNKTSFTGKIPVKVVCLSKSGDYIDTFDSIKKAEEFNGKSIWNVLIGKRKSSGGYLWVYESKFNKMSENDLRDYIDECNTDRSINNGVESRFKKNEKPHNSKRINQFSIDGDFIKTWEDSVEASLSLTGKKRSGINNCAIGKSKTSLGFVWQYVD